MSGLTGELQGLRGAGSPFDRVVGAGLFRDPALFGELFARVRLDAIAQGLPMMVAGAGDGRHGGQQGQRGGGEEGDPGRGRAHAR